MVFNTVDAPALELFVEMAETISSKQEKRLFLYGRFGSLWTKLFGNRIN